MAINIQYVVEDEWKQMYNVVRPDEYYDPAVHRNVVVTCLLCYTGLLVQTEADLAHTCESDEYETI